MITMPRSLLNCTAMMPSASPEFCMPPSIITARRSRTLTPMATLVR